MYHLKAMAQLKYNAHVSPLSSCPPAQCCPQDLVAYRFVQADLTDPNNFRPPAILQPSRSFGDDCCAAFALSFFTSVSAATKRYEQLVGKRRNLANRIGSHLAEVSITTSDGLLSPTGAHRDLHEFASTDLRPRARIVQALTIGSSHA